MGHQEIKNSDEIEKLREERKQLKKELTQHQTILSKTINTNLDLFDYILNTNYTEICDFQYLKSHFTKIVLERQKEISDECFKKILFQFENIFINSSKIDFTNEYLELINLIKLLYCFINLEERVVGEDSIFVSINLISLECYFWNDNEFLSKLNPLTLPWSLDEETKVIFQKNIKRPISIEKLNNFVLSKKLELFLKYTNVYLSLEKRTLLMLNSYSRSIFSFIEATELNLTNSELFITNFFNELKEVLIGSRQEEPILALVFSHIMCYNVNLVSFADIGWFKEKESIYYVKWIENYKENL